MFSPMKGNKYKNFLTSLLSPSAPKRLARRKAATSFQEADSATAAKSVLHSNESIYSSLGESDGASRRQSSFSSDVLQCASSSGVGQSPGDIMAELQMARMEIAPEEPLYASVRKDDNKMLLQRMKELSEENRLLKKQFQGGEKHEKMKEDIIHSKLQLEITQLEAETRKEVKSLSDRIALLAEEKSLLSEQIDLLHREKREAQTRCEVLSEEARIRISPELHKKRVEEYRKLLEQAKQKHAEETREYKGLCKALEDARNTLQVQVRDVGEKVVFLQMKIKTLEDEDKDLRRENAELNQHMEESRQMEHDHQKLLLSLLKVTETLAVERDILLNKESFQETRQRELHTSVADYSLNLGRLQEHISNLGKENVQELFRLYSRQPYQDANVHEFYGEQLDTLRQKILNQNNVITELECRNRYMYSPFSRN